MKANANDITSSKSEMPEADALESSPEEDIIAGDPITGIVEQYDNNIIHVQTFP